MITKLKLFLIVAFIAIGHSISYSQIVGTPYILPTNNLTLVNFDYTGAAQQWRVPDGVTEIFVDLMGAQGGTRGSVLGGAGGRVRCKIAVTSGQILYLTVGGRPTSDVPVYGFGGNGGYHISYPAQRAMAGGGLSAISTALPLTQANALVIAGGGGGASGNPSFSPAAAGGLIAGSVTGDYGGSSIGGKGGNQSAGGSAGVPHDSNSTSPTAGTALNGGNGGIINPGSGLTGWNGGGGGGAGYFGGGGGAGGGNAQAGGGGGSSWIKPAAPVLAVGSINMGNQNTSGNGVINIYY